MSNREQMIAMGFHPKDIDLADMYIGLVANLLESDRRHSTLLRRGISILAVKMNALVPDFDAGRQVGPVGAGDLAEAMDPIPTETIENFIEIAGTIMLSSQDGPLGSAPAMKSVIDELEEKMDGGA